MPDDLRRAINLSRQAVAECPAGNPAKPMMLAHLAESLGVRSDDDGAPGTTGGTEVWIGP
ncbi:hypothetical protein [Amycolatopsis sp. lyj-346]|uniref:hypothetical protein n=1 Tax=Amycolatopsis sp. lyj-346 TaxID=2789289 RepID=UPI00397A5FF5